MSLSLFPECGYRTRAIVDEIVDLVFDLICCVVPVESLAVRFRQEGRGFPVYRRRGNNEHFQSEQDCAAATDEDGNFVLQCLCGDVLEGRLEPNAEGVTAFGSFYTNAAEPAMFRVVEGDAAAQPCVVAGFKSMGLVPLRHDDIAQGLIRLSDRAPNRLNGEAITTVENISRPLASIVLKAMLLGRKRSAEEFRIIVVDADPHIRQLHRRLLKFLGFESIEAVDGDRALATLENERIHLLLTDLTTKQGGGIDLIRAVRERYGPYGPRIIVISACTHRLSKAETGAYDISSVLEKPIGDIDTFADDIESALATSR